MRKKIEKQTLPRETTISRGGELEYNTDQIEIFETDPAHIRVEAGFTKKVDDFEFVKLNVSIEMPCYKEKLEEAYETASEKVQELLQKEMDIYI